MNYQKNKINHIPINACVHYRAYRYGLFGNNIYEDYIRTVELNINIIEARKKFVRQILGTRSHNFGETLNIVLSKEYKNWDMPWTLIKQNQRNFTAKNNPDIICHTSSEGVLASHLNREFKWLENALASIKEKSYNPERYGFINVLELKHNQKKRYLVTDGNHRLSALAALGENECRAIIKRNFLLNSKYMEIWPKIILKHYTKEDALKIFTAYFREKNPPIRESKEKNQIIFDEPLQILIDT